MDTRRFLALMATGGLVLLLDASASSAADDKDKPPANAKEAIAAFQVQAKKVAAGVKDEGMRKFLEGQIRNTDKLHAQKMKFSAAFERVDSTLTEQERKTLILHGAVKDLRRDGECWAVEAIGGFGNALAGYLDERTGKLVFLWIIPEG